MTAGSIPQEEVGEATIRISACDTGIKYEGVIMRHTSRTKKKMIVEEGRQLKSKKERRKSKTFIHPATLQLCVLPWWLLNGN